MTRAPSSPVAALLSGIAPGLGHWYAGIRRQAVWLGTATLVLALPAAILGFIVLFRGGPRSFLGLVRPFFDHPGYLLILLALNAAILLFRIVAALDAHSRTPSAARPGPIVGVAVIATLAAVVLVPHAWAAQRTIALYDLLTYDYSVDPGQAAATTTTPPTTSTPPPTTTTATSAPATTTPPPETTSTAPVTTTVPTTTTTLAPPAARRVNVLLLGGDAGPDRTGIRTDTMIVVSVDPVTGDAAMFGVPRNTFSTPIPPEHPAYDLYDCHCYPNLLNALYQTGLHNPDAFPGGPNSGANAVKDVVGHLLGIEIHRYVLVDLLGFVDVIDALGTLTITVTDGVYDELYTRPDGEVVPVSYPPGTYEMDGQEALAYARVRRGSSDYYRMSRQRCVLEAIVDRAEPTTVLRALPWLVPAIQGSLLTDIPVEDWPDFIELAAMVDTGSIVSVRFMPGAPELTGTGTSYTAGRSAGGYPYPNVDLIRETVATIMSLESTQAADIIGVPQLDEVCR